MHTRQRKLSNNIGKDTHVRNRHENIFTEFNHNVTTLVMGEISETEPEPMYQQTLVEVELARGGKIDHVAYPGAFIDTESGNLHGLYEGPIKGQMVVIGFENGNLNNPFVVQRYPYQGKGDTTKESDFMMPLQTAEFNPEDIALGHKSGSYLVFNTGLMPSTKLPGSFYMKTISDLELETDTDFSIKASMGGKIETSMELEIKSDLNIKLSAGTSVTIETDAGGKLELSEDGSFSFEDSAGNSISSSPTQISINDNLTVDLQNAIA